MLICICTWLQAIIEGVVQDYKDIYKDAVEKRLESPNELPYFEGDFWTTVLEDCVKVSQSVSPVDVATF